MSRAEVKRLPVIVLELSIEEAQKLSIALAPVYGANWDVESKLDEALHEAGAENHDWDYEIRGDTMVRIFKPEDEA